MGFPTMWLCATSKASDQPAHLEFLGLNGGCTGSSLSTLVKMPHCWKSRVVAQIISGVTVQLKVDLLIFYCITIIIMTHTSSS